MDLRQLHSDPRAMAAFLGIPWEPQERPAKTNWYYPSGRNMRGPMETVQPETIVAETVSAIVRANEAEWVKSKHNQFKPLTWGRMIGEALTAMGITGGTIAERTRRLIEQRFYNHERTRKENWWTTAQFDYPGEDKKGPRQREDVFRPAPRRLTLQEALDANEPQSMVA